MNRLLFEADAIAPDGGARVSGEAARHLRDVLHATPGQTVRIGLLDGPPGIGTVQAVTGDEIRMTCALEAVTPERPPVDLLLALPRPKVMRRLWPQLAAMGVDQIVLTNAAKVERMYFDTHVLRPDVVRPLLIDGVQQAGDTRLPQVHIVRRLKPWIEDALDRQFPDGVRLLADPAAGRRVAEALGGGRPSARRVVLAVGPEGGWTAFETELLAVRGFMPVSMGARTLRTDTACIALLALIHERLRDLTPAATVPPCARPPHRIR
jgi:16S rRNA (uracil1498-N3)-methyltransferase